MDNMLNNKSDITDYGQFPLLELPQRHDNVFVDTNYGLIEESLLRTIIKEEMRAELDKMRADMQLLYISGNDVYYNGSRLVKAEEIFTN